MRAIKCILLLSSLSVVYALELSFFTRWYYAAQRTLGFGPPRVRVAIIGAGAGGSSAAFWIQKANERFGDDLEVDVYEKESYIGGRAAVVYPYNNRSLGCDELGGSIFIKANRNLYRASQEFNLTLKNLDDETNDFGVWDGNQLVLNYRGTYWDKAKLFWKYGYKSLSKPDAEANMLKTKLDTVYTPELPTWFSVSRLSEELGFTNLTSQTGLGYLSSQGVSPQYTLEILEGVTRINYAQNMGSMHALGATVGLAATGASQVVGGNFQIFENFLKYSKARVFLDTAVTSLTKQDEPGKNVRWKLSTSSTHKVYDHVIVATPFKQSTIELSNSLADFNNPPVEYVQLHVTLLTTTSASAKPERVGLKPRDRVPKIILTNSQNDPDFRSIAYWRTIKVEGRDEHVFKVFSLDEKSDSWLEDVFGEGTLRWVHRKVWRSYPKLVPTTTFPAIKADDGLWYVNSLEPWISTLETETLSSRNIVDNLLAETFGHGLCPNATTSVGWGSKVYGWDC